MCIFQWAFLPAFCRLIYAVWRKKWIIATVNQKRYHSTLAREIRQMLTDFHKISPSNSTLIFVLIKVINEFAAS